VTTADEGRAIAWRSSIDAIRCELTSGRAAREELGRIREACLKVLGEPDRGHSAEDLVARVAALARQKAGG
jgi:hypothetical protein